MKKIMLVICCLCFFSSLSAWDGKRQGFIFGGGLGIGPAIITGSGADDLVDWDVEVRVPVVTSFYIGGALNDQLMMYYNEKTNWYKLGGHIWTASNSTFAITYFFEEEAPSFEVSGGIGLATVSAIDVDSETNYGIGLHFTAGFEFYPHCMVEGGVQYSAVFDTLLGETIAIHHLVPFVGLSFFGY